MSFSSHIRSQLSKNAGIKRVLKVGVLVLLLVMGLMSQAQNEPPKKAQNKFEWKDASHQVRSLSDLEEILEKHRQWEEPRRSGARVDPGSTKGTQANLNGADLWEASLPGADLIKAKLDKATLIDANLEGAKLDNASLIGVNLWNAKLTGASLTQAHLNDAYLVDTHFERAHLSGADLAGANMQEAKLHSADLQYANLTGAQLHGADLTSANLVRADLTGAILTDANLQGAGLLRANLTHALLFRTNLGDATIEEADLNGAVFEPKSLPPVRGMARAKSLELLTYDENPDMLVQLRKQFEDGGFRDEERKITYALKRREAEVSWLKGMRKTSSLRPVPDNHRPILFSADSVLANFASFTLNRVFFDWTCQYGMSPGRPLVLGVFVWLLCSFLYLACAHTSGEAGLYRVYAPDVHDDPKAPPRVEQIPSPRAGESSKARSVFRATWDELLLLRTSMFFSMMSAFKFGFHDLNFGRWLGLLTRQEFDIKAVGWTRVIAGWQSLISVFLIALWVLTYFGRPFN